MLIAIFLVMSYFLREGPQKRPYIPIGCNEGSPKHWERQLSKQRAMWTRVVEKDLE